MSSAGWVRFLSSDSRWQAFAGCLSLFVGLAANPATVHAACGDYVTTSYAAGAVGLAMAHAGMNTDDINTDESFSAPPAQGGTNSEPCRGPHCRRRPAEHSVPAGTPVSVDQWALFAGHLPLQRNHGFGMVAEPFLGFPVSVLPVPEHPPRCCA
jgi:hypothetical protein